ncbi:hypothetical protein DCO58_02470 [Helicobacter saguini]|uniref:Uncharacterized protein n=1 Tax=Helicobacter saguini TaxID=1548018 RepID=A0A347VRV7_9HELI|nr:hypothetical protein [Helicobacter saguini]MWV62759.1 hypothetical protein [Helicobacter saguini]MWV66572.1 hypothetical protein [Helicobacter saguini]MWV68921.1 hypothetical protein [Helicobacter saguini]MWV71524.1 hypothetical protein [Helicobacter saguini]TLD93622.1 hypothetical protein LS64_008305 [Helicobacter saguini]
MSEQQVNIKVDNGSSGLVGLALAFFFSVVGAFFAWWMIAKYSFAKSFLYALGYTILFTISIVLCFFVIGFIMLPIVEIIMLVMVYKACSNQSVVVQMPSIETKESA